MKVAMLGWEFPPFIAGGLGLHCLELTRGLARKNVAIDFYMPHMASIEGPLRVADSHSHLRIIEVESDPSMSPYGGRPGKYEESFNDAVSLYNRRLTKVFDSHDADVIHCHDWITVPAALELRRRTHLPLVLTVHSTEFDRSAGLNPQPWIEDIERRGVRGADRVIAVSRYTKGLLETTYGAPPDRVIPVHNGVSFTRLSDGPDRDYDARRGTVLFLSRVSRQKGPLYFLQAAERVLEVRPDARFVFAGEGHMLPECIEYAFERGIADRVKFTGFVPSENMAAFYAQNEIYVLPSVSEPFGISILEAMAAGLPTIVSKTTGVGEALAHVLKADYWDTDEMADMILRLLDSPALREELGRNGAKEAHKFSWDATCRRTLEVYAGLLAERGKGMAVPA